MRILVACEFSGVVREAFRAKGHDAWSCDLEPSEIPGQHIQGDALSVLGDRWDLMVAHPPCTYLTVTGNKWFKPEYTDRFPTRHDDRRKAIEFFRALADAPIARKCIENPVGIMSTVWRKPDQIIQPFEFGHPEPKKTCLWLEGLPLLKGTEQVEPDYVVYNGKKHGRWYYEASYSLRRQQLRNRTFQGIGNAMADQWGGGPLPVVATPQPLFDYR